MEHIYRGGAHVTHKDERVLRLVKDAVYRVRASVKSGDQSRFSLSNANHLFAFNLNRYADFGFY